MNRTTLFAIPAIVALSCFLLSTRTSSGLDDREERTTPEQHEDHEHPEVTRAVCVLQPVGDSGVTGTIYFTVHEDSVTIEGTAEGLTPGEHGCHVHEFGDLSDQEAGESAGGHFNPHGEPHGGPNDAHRHPGDFGNIEADENGVAEVRIEGVHLELQGDHGVLGRSLVVHANADDFSQPSGNAGPRVAFGVIGVAKTEMP